MEEVDTLKQKLDCWEVRKVSECLEKTGRQPLPTRWIDCDKNGGSGEPLLRSRLVVCETKRRSSIEKGDIVS
eukprot:12932871-Prorocentrum_lima.AAC.1